MQTGKIVLSAAALMATAASIFAFKALNRFSMGHKLFVQVTDGSGINSACVTCRSVRTRSELGSYIGGCVTSINLHIVLARNAKTFFTKVKAGSLFNKTCTSPFSKATISL